MPDQDSKQLWTLRIETTRRLLHILEGYFEDTALSLSSTVPPRKKKVLLEALLDTRPQKRNMEIKLALLAEKEGQPAPKLTIKKVPQIDWVEKVAHDFPPLQIGRWTIFTKAHRGEVTSAKHPLQIEATSAFGTGEHPTTYGCLLLLEDLLKKHKNTYKWKMLDIGCGSGILSMAFACASKGMAFGGELDLPSLEIAKKNLRINKLENGVEFFHADGYKHPIIGSNAPFDLIMANIFAGPLCSMAPDLKASLKSGGTAILSGILQSQEEEVIDAHQTCGLTLQKKIHIKEWSILEFCNPSVA